jgi:BirA family transcriptional regulator, biotin operon repressor / biotin---[acetyl-CoA-carboxylase] ligase
VNAALLRQLRDADGAFVPLEALAGPLGDLDELEAFGFALERHPLRGVAYRGPAERLCPDQIEDALDTARVGRRVAVWNRVVSTNDLAARAALSSANEGLVILAEEQTAGRGRRGRSWLAPPRTSILMSVLLFPPEPLADPAWLTALGAVAVAGVLSEWSGHEARIKWPNDVRVDGRKVAGVLVERAAGAVVGIGLNANLTRDDFPAELRDTATSLRILMGRPVDRSELARDLIRRIDALYETSRSTGPEPLALQWRDRCEHLGRAVVVETRSGCIRGCLVDIDLLGSLTLGLPGAAPVHIVTREVTALSAATPD